MMQVNTTTTNKFELERENYMRELHDLRIKYFQIFNQILKEAQIEQVATTNR